MNATDAALLGALVGAGVALAGSVLASLVSWRIERARQHAAKAAADVETLRRHTADAFSELFALNHAISWITWFATYAPHAVNQQMKASFDASSFSPRARVVITAMKDYGLVLADNGSPWFFQGERNGHWPFAMIDELKQIPASQFVAVDTSSLRVSRDSGATAP